MERMIFLAHSIVKIFSWSSLKRFIAEALNNICKVYQCNLCNSIIYVAFNMIVEIGWITLVKIIFCFQKNPKQKTCISLYLKKTNLVFDINKVQIPILNLNHTIEWLKWLHNDILFGGYLYFLKRCWKTILSHSNCVELNRSKDPWHLQGFTIWTVSQNPWFRKTWVQAIANVSSRVQTHVQCTILSSWKTNLIYSKTTLRWHRDSYKIQVISSLVRLRQLNQNQTKTHSWYLESKLGCMV